MLADAVAFAELLAQSAFEIYKTFSFGFDFQYIYTYIGIYICNFYCKFSGIKNLELYILEFKVMGS